MAPCRGLIRHQRGVEQVEPSGLPQEVRRVRCGGPVTAELVMPVHVADSAAGVCLNEFREYRVSGLQVQAGQIADEDPLELCAACAWRSTARQQCAAVRVAVIVLVQNTVDYPRLSRGENPVGLLAGRLR